MTQLSTDRKVVWKPLPGSQTLVLSCPANIILYHGTRGPGKGLPLTEPVYTPHGVKEIGSLKVGDFVVCPDGTESKVIGVYPQGIRPVYEITFDDGALARCDDNHIWPIHIQDGNKPGAVKEFGYQNMAMPELLERYVLGQRLHIPTLDRLEMRYAQRSRLVVEPYILGLLLGDGSFTQAGSYCTVDNDLANCVLLAGFTEWAKDSRSEVRNFGFSADVRKGVTELGLFGKLSDSKFIPMQYLNAAAESRLALLQGLMDTDGTADKSGYITFSSASKALSEGVQYLVRSLGGKATLSVKKTSFEGVQNKDAYEIYIQPGNKFNCFRLERKQSRVTGYMHKKLWRRIVNIKELPQQETVCIKIAHPLGLFITRDFVVTHNTDSQLMRFRRNVGRGYKRFWRGVIFDREYKNLDDLISKSLRWFPEFKDGARFISSKSDYKWVWPSGEELLFRVLKRDSDYWGYHGQEFAFIGWNELTKFPNSNLFEMMMSCNRTSFIPEEHSLIIDGDIFKRTGQVVLCPPNLKRSMHYVLPEIPLEVFATCNPHGVGHNWVKKRFINAAPMGKLFKKTTRIFNPRTQRDEDVVKTQVHVFGSYRENKYLSPEYVAELASITDPNKRKAWLGGSWDIIAGGMFDDVWDSKTHVVKPFRIPSSWKIDRSFDWGSSRPFSVGWWAESDGSDFIDENGVAHSTVRGDLFRIGEWYGTNGKTNEGLRLLATDIATGIIERQLAMGIHSRVKPGPADNSIYDTENGVSIAKDMSKKTRANGIIYEGVTWTRSDKSAGSRKHGWEAIRTMLSNALKKEGFVREKPGLFVFDTCTYFLDLFPILPRDETDPDDVDTDAEDHIGDEVRYKVLSTSTGARAGKTVGVG